MASAAYWLPSCQSVVTSHAARNDAAARRAGADVHESCRLAHFGLVVASTWTRIIHFNAAGTRIASQRRRVWLRTPSRRDGSLAIMNSATARPSSWTCIRRIGSNRNPSLTTGMSDSSARRRVFLHQYGERSCGAGAVGRRIDSNCPLPAQAIHERNLQACVE